MVQAAEVMMAAMGNVVSRWGGILDKRERTFKTGWLTVYCPNPLSIDSRAKTQSRCVACLAADGHAD
jgi:hypothetical protein